jgi:Fe2+ transport system protein FeoA
VIKLHQKQPTYVIRIGETELALDSDLAKDIFVKKTS